MNCGDVLKPAHGKFMVALAFGGGLEMTDKDTLHYWTTGYRPGGLLDETQVTKIKVQFFLYGVWATLLVGFVIKVLS
jgi:hypothetical protein